MQIVGLEKYDITKDGRITRISTGRIYSPYKCSGYLGIKLEDNEGRRISRLIHRLVVETYIGPIPQGMWVNHKNGDKTDNRLENLEVVTPSANLIHAYRELKCNRVKGHGVHVSLLSADAIEAIKLLVGAGWSQARIARAFEVSQCSISNIVTGKTWKVDAPTEGVC